jgi:exopolysaccharide biosynthesis WecB/TagA/CpsF family protein
MPTAQHQTHHAPVARSAPAKAAAYDAATAPGVIEPFTASARVSVLSDVLPAELCLTSATEQPLAAVDGWPVNIANEADAVAKITAAARRGESFAAFTLNLDHLVKLRSSAVFREAYMHARFVTADGAPVAKLASRQNARIERTTGADLVAPLARAAADAGLAVYLFGTSPQVIAQSAADLAERCDGRLDIAGSAAPAMGFDPEGAEADAAIDTIAASGARLCFVALGAPKQEIFAARAVARGAKCGFVCVGAALDFISGEQSRAPRVMQTYGLEWLWRLGSSPRRLAWRYLSCALLLADILIFGPAHHPPRPQQLAG